MAKIPFFKYQGTGNDFILVDNRRPHLKLHKTDSALFQRWCDRRFGIGADGLILLQNAPVYDFEMVYFNSDGRESSMCGNGGRCIVAFARHLHLIRKKCRFLAVDGPHEAIVRGDGWVELKMSDVTSVEQGDGFFVMNTGSPHYVVFAEDVSDLNIKDAGQQIRYSERFQREGINVNFVEKTAAGILVATYERGVEDETLSCGTGVTAAAISHFLAQPLSGKAEVSVSTKGGELTVRFEPDSKGGFRDIWLCGPAELVFEGKMG